jgi:hypothetical protein
MLHIKAVSQFELKLYVGLHTLSLLHKQELMHAHLHRRAPWEFVFIVSPSWQRTHLHLAPSKSMNFATCALAAFTHIPTSQY